MKKKLVLLSFLLSTFNLNANNEKENFWSKVIDAIIQIESKGKHDAISPSGKYVGAMQIAKIVVDDCNEFMEMKNISKRYQYDDRFNLQKSKEMFIIIQDRYNKERNIEKAVRIWNGGCGYNKQSTDAYYSKFLKIYNKI